MFTRNIRLYLVLALLSLSAAIALHTYGYDLWQDVATGIFSAILLIIVLELRDHRRDQLRYGILKGIYNRIAFKLPDHERTFDTIYTKDVPFKPTSINLRYEGIRKYVFQIEYDEGIVHGTFYTDEHSAEFGTGLYQYIKKPSADFGTYTFYRDQLNPKLLYVLHKNILPSGLAEGLEIWERQEVGTK